MRRIVRVDEEKCFERLVRVTAEPNEGSRA